MDKYKKLLSDTGIFAIGNLGSKLLVFLLVPFYTNILSTSDYGIADLITTTVSVVLPIFCLAIYDSVLRFTLDKNYKPKDVFVTSSIIILISSLFVLIIKPLVVSFASSLISYYWFFLFIYLGTAFNTSISNYLRGIDKIKVFASKGIFYSLVFAISNVLLLKHFSLGLKGYLFAILLSEWLTCAYMLIAGKLDLIGGVFNYKLLKEMLIYSIPLIPAILGWWIMQLSDKYMIIHFSGLAESGVYAISYKIPTILSVLTSIFIQAWQIAAIKSVDDKDKDKFASTIYNYFNLFSVIVCSLLIIFSKGLSYLLFKKEYFIAWQYVPFLLIAYLFSGICGVLASLFSAKKKTNIMFYSTLAGALINISLNLLIIPRYGALGAAFSTMVAFALTWGLRLIVIRKIYVLNIKDIRDVLAFVLLFLEALFCIKEFHYVLSISIIVVLFILYLKEIRHLINVFAYRLKNQSIGGGNVQ